MNDKAITIDAEGKSLGRLATHLAALLRGKNTVAYQPHRLVPRTVIVKNCGKLSIQSKKLDQKIYYRTSGHPGAMKEEKLRDAFAKSPSAVVLRTVRGMLPSNKQRRTLLMHLNLED